jgi:hypothetical protein
MNARFNPLTLLFPGARDKALERLAIALSAPPPLVLWGPSHAVIAALLDQCEDDESENGAGPMVVKKRGRRRRSMG